MQPYLFPYIGYIQLMSAVDTFVFLNDVNYINKGWINRNQVLVNGSASLFTVPLKEASQNKLISEIDQAIDDQWKKKFTRTLEMNYKNAPCYTQGMELVTEVLHSGEKKIDDFIVYSFNCIRQKLDLPVTFKRSSDMKIDPELKGQYRILEICKQLDATVYVNPPGGRDLYDKTLFDQQNIQLKFIQPGFVPYPQNAPAFVPGLSFVDVCMNNTYPFIRQNLLAYHLAD